MLLILDRPNYIPSCPHEDHDPFDDLYSVNPSAELDNLSSQVPLPKSEARCSATEYINGEDLPTCSDEGDEAWEEDFFHISQLIPTFHG